MSEHAGGYPTIRFLAEQGRVVLGTKHARDERDDWGFELKDITECIVTANLNKIKRERDELQRSVDGNKYRINGRDTHGRPFFTEVKIMPSKFDEGLVVFVISAHPIPSPRKRRRR